MALIGLAGFSFWATGCRKAPPPRNLLLITLDTQRADYISAYDPQHVRTPNIDSLAGRGTVFKNCYSLIPITMPSHASMFFSEPPHQLKVYNNGQSLRPSKYRPALATLFKKNGFRTAAFVSLGILEAQFGLNEGFDTYEDKFRTDRWYLTADEVNDKVLPWLDRNGRDPFFMWVHYSDPHDPYAVPGIPPDTKVYLNGKLVGSEFCMNRYITYAVDLILEPGPNEIVFEVDNPFYKDKNNFQARLDKFLFYGTPPIPDKDIVLAKGWFHRSTDDVFFFRQQGRMKVINRAGRRPVKMTFRGKLVIPVDEMKVRYGREVEYMDGQIGRLWQKMNDLGLAANTAVVIVGDHGEGLGEYLSDYKDRHVGHIHYLYNAYLKVPLIVALPSGNPKPLTRDENVSLLDLAPTITAIMGIRRPDFYQGRNLLKLKKNARLSLTQETFRPEAVSDKFAILQAPWHLIFTPSKNRYELFNQDQDPGEQNNLFGSGALPPQIAALKQVLNELARDVLSRKEDVPVTDRNQEMLKSLGYLKN